MTHTQFLAYTGKLMLSYYYLAKLSTPLACAGNSSSSARECKARSGEQSRENYEFHVFLFELSNRIKCSEWNRQMDAFASDQNTLYIQSSKRFHLRPLDCVWANLFTRFIQRTEKLMKAYLKINSECAIWSTFLWHSYCLWMIAVQFLHMFIFEINCKTTNWDMTLPISTFFIFISLAHWVNQNENTFVIGSKLLALTRANKQISAYKMLPSATFWVITMIFFRAESIQTLTIRCGRHYQQFIWRRCIKKA